MNINIVEGEMEGDGCNVGDADGWKTRIALDGKAPYGKKVRIGDKNVTDRYG